MENRQKLFEERNHYKALYEHERDIAAEEIRRLDAEIVRLKVALEKIENEMCDDTSPRAQRINRVIAEVTREGEIDAG